MKITIIGSGFAGLAASCYLAKAGHEVHVIEKNEAPGGRASVFQKEGFTFDMGPSFYWMPDVFDSFFADFGKKTSDYYQLVRLDPSYRIYFGSKDPLDVPGTYGKVLQAFEDLEPGSAKKLNRFVRQAQGNYNLAIKDLVYQPGESLTEIFSWGTLKRVFAFFGTIKSQAAGVVKDRRLREVLEFPSLFLGARPEDTPQFYNFMNYADLVLGTWYPKGGMYKVVEAMVALAQELGVQFHCGKTVDSIGINASGEAEELIMDGEHHLTDLVLSGADYAHTEKLLPRPYRQYSDTYWKKRTFAPSALLFFIGFKERIPGICHHTLFFDADFKKHATEIYKTKSWPNDPLFYASFPSVTDRQVAPAGMECATILIPLATHLPQDPQREAQLFDRVLDRMEQSCGAQLRDKILFRETFSPQDFGSRYNAYGNNAYGLANILTQTHVLRPKLKSSKIRNLYFTGQTTVPGPGVPPSLISGKIVADLILKYHRNS